MPNNTNNIFIGTMFEVIEVIGFYTLIYTGFSIRMVYVKLLAVSKLLRYVYLVY